MKKAIAIVGLVLACGGAEEDRNSYDPAPADSGSSMAIRIDGTPWEDGAFASPAERDEWCAREPQQPMCQEIDGELGQARQAWRSAEYHGIRANSNTGTCHSVNGGDCLFPRYKQLHVWFNSNQCAQFLSSRGYGAQTIADFIRGVSDGLSAWHNKGGVTVVADGFTGPAVNFKHTIHMSCERRTDAALGAHFYHNGTCSDPGNQVGATNLAAGPTSGNDPRDAIQCLQSTIVLDPVNMLGTCAASQIRGVARLTTSHEVGHALGFGHFTNTSIIPITQFLQSCFPLTTFTSNVVQAIGDYNGSPNGMQITNRGLHQFGPITGN